MLRIVISAQEKLYAFKKNISGATAIEYGLIAAGIGLVVLVAASALGDQLEILFGKIKDGLAK